MSESGLHTHAPHEEAVEHGAAHGPGLSQWVAIFTALLAALGAIVSYQGSQLMDEVLLAKNDAVLKKAHATDQWNYYQAISTKLHLMELARDIAPPARQADADVRDIARGIEELRVSLWAQQLGTPRPVSEQRIYRAIDAARDRR